MGVKRWYWKKKWPKCYPLLASSYAQMFERNRRRSNPSNLLADDPFFARLTFRDPKATERLLLACNQFVFEDIAFSVSVDNLLFRSCTPSRRSFALDYEAGKTLVYIKTEENYQLVYDQNRGKESLLFSGPWEQDIALFVSQFQAAERRMKPLFEKEEADIWRSIELADKANNAQKEKCLRESYQRTKTL